MRSPAGLFALVALALACDDDSPVEPELLHVAGEYDITSRWQSSSCGTAFPEARRRVVVGQGRGGRDIGVSFGTTNLSGLIEPNTSFVAVGFGRLEEFSPAYAPLGRGTMRIEGTFTETDMSATLSIETRIETEPGVEVPCTVRFGWSGPNLLGPNEIP